MLPTHLGAFSAIKLDPFLHHLRGSKGKGDADTALGGEYDRNIAIARSEHRRMRPLGNLRPDRDSDEIVLLAFPGGRLSRLPCLQDEVCTLLCLRLADRRVGEYGVCTCRSRG